MRLWLIAVNVVGGVAVLGSYAHGLLTHPDTSGAVWGGVPASLKPWYIVSMLTAAAGYFLFSYYIGFALDPERARIGERFGFGVFVWLYALLLAASAFWMPLTFAMIETPTAALWIAIRTVLFLVALGSLGLLIAIATATPRAGDWSYWLALLGATAFCIQTVVLDAFVWPAYFPR